MKRYFGAIVIILMLGILLLSGCGNYVAKEEFTKVQTDLTAAKSDLAAVKSDLAAAKSSMVTAQSQIKLLSASDGYNIWYDQYYRLGTAYQYYAFADVDAFNKKLGTIIDATGDSVTLTAWQDYLKAHKALIDLVKSLPEDYNKWNAEQTSKWKDATAVRYTALGKVGTALFNVISK